MSLKRTIIITVSLIFLVLTGLLALGLRQYQLNRQHQEIAKQAEKVIFQFAIVREHLTDSLLGGRHDRLSEISTEMEALQQNLSAILANAHIPDEYKLTFLNQIDLPGIILLLRDTESLASQPEKRRRLNRQVRVLGERLTLLDRVIINYAKKSLIRLQYLIIGALAISVFILTLALFFLYRRMALPIISLAKQVDEVRESIRSEIRLPGKSQEVIALSRLVNSLLSDCRSNRELGQKALQVRQVALELLAVLQRADGEEELLREACKALLVNNDFSLVWFGVRRDESGFPVPLAVDGSTTMTGAEYQACLDGIRELTKKRGLENDPAARALHTGKPVIDRDFLAGCPLGTFKNTPFQDGKASSLHLPLLYKGNIYGVANIYTTEPDRFDDREVAELSSMVNTVAFCLESLDKNSGKAEVFRASQLATIGEMAADIAHEINDLSNGIINYAQVLQDEGEGGAMGVDQQELVSRIINEGERIAAISGKLQACAGENESGYQKFSVEQLIEDALEILNHRIRNDGVKLVRDLEDDAPLFTGNKQHIRHLFLNLFNNGLQALNQRYPGKNENKVIEVRGKNYTENGKSFYRVAITDRGSGISASDIKKVFEAGFSTRMQEGGSGLGLTVSREIIENYGGRIDVDSIIGDHTRVTVDFPLAEN